MSRILENKIALVTGSSHGLGKRILAALDASGVKGLGFDTIAVQSQRPYGVIRGPVGSHGENQAPFWPA